jgi:hypothetical protein
MVNSAVETSTGDVVCIEKGVKLRYDVKYQARLINTEEFFITDAQSLYGFVAGIFASNHDVTDLFIDSAYKICKDNAADFDVFVEEIGKLSDKVGVNVVATASIPVEDASETVKKFI